MEHIPSPRPNRSTYICLDVLIKSHALFNENTMSFLPMFIKVMKIPGSPCFLLHTQSEMGSFSPSSNQGFCCQPTNQPTIQPTRFQHDGFCLLKWSRCLFKRSLNLSVTSTHLHVSQWCMTSLCKLKMSNVNVHMFIFCFIVVRYQVEFTNIQQNILLSITVHTSASRDMLAILFSVKQTFQHQVWTVIVNRMTSRGQ